MSDSHDKNAMWANWNVNGRAMKIEDLDKGMLKFCLENGFTGKDTKVTPRNKEDFEWLRKVWDSLEDDGKKMMALISTLHDKSATESAMVGALEELEFYVEDINNANDFSKLGGFEVIISLLRDKAPKVRAAAAMIAALLTSNNPAGKVAFCSRNGVDALAAQLTAEDDCDAQRRLLSAWSALIDNSAELSKLFVDKCLSRVADLAEDSADEAVVFRAVVVLKHLTEPKVLAALAPKLGDLVPLLAHVFSRTQAPNVREHVLIALANLLSSPSGAFKTQVKKEAELVRDATEIAAIKRTDDNFSLVDAAKAFVKLC